MKIFRRSWFCRCALTADTLKCVRRYDVKFYEPAIRLPTAVPASAPTRFRNCRRSTPRAGGLAIGTLWPPFYPRPRAGCMGPKSHFPGPRIGESSGYRKRKLDEPTINIL